MRNGWKEVFDSWEPVVAGLRSRGFVIAHPYSVAFPVQLEGRLPDGRSFYFRERNGHASLGVGGPEPSWTPVESAQEDLWSETVLPLKFLAATDFEPVVDRLRSRLILTGWAEVHRAWQTAAERLAAIGFRIQQKTFDPTWLEGVLPNGERFYLRQFPLEESCFLGVGGDDPERSPAWSVTEGWIEQSPLEAPSQRPERAEAMLRRALQERSG